ncbi:hypothetical protein DSLASN_33430 [Desulfoluna limicola]|uniref:Uncharacterized protein n=1 Tax=Desulfoluna limicola TaxID=2810562 RepID=A0ABN6F7J9_9BACT|nr:hypothetical protein DSLASN_33430 [Desulfoluna limicola]
MGKARSVPIIGELISTEAIGRSIGTLTSSPGMAVITTRDGHGTTFAHPTGYILNERLSLGQSDMVEKEW